MIRRFWAWVRGEQDEPSIQLARIVRQCMPEVDDTTVCIVAAIAGLLATVAYADGRYAPEEEARIRAELGRIEGLPPAGVDAICQALRERLADIAAVEAPVHARQLLALADRELRCEVLDALVDLAAADDVITVAEVNQLRLLTTALGLSQDDYNASQARHREKLSVLKG